MLSVDTRTPSAVVPVTADRRRRAKPAPEAAPSRCSSGWRAPHRSQKTSGPRIPPKHARKGSRRAVGIGTGFARISSRRIHTGWSQRSSNGPLLDSPPMAGPLAAVERFFERLFERPAARLFQTQIDLSQIERALERVMESDRRVQSRKSYVPTNFRVLLNDGDAAALDGDLRTMAGELAESLRVYARAHGYIMLAQPRVEIGSSSTVPTNDVRAFAEPVALPAKGNGNSVPGSPLPPRPPTHTPAPPELVGEPTAVYAAPRTAAPKAQLAIRAPGHQLMLVPVRPGTLRLGRSLDNDIVLPDDKVSRHHGQIGVRLGMLVYTDLGSTNGSFLNGSAVTEIALGPGDVLQLGSSTVTIEPTS